MLTPASANATAFRWFAVIKSASGPIVSGPHNDRATSEDVAASFPGELLSIKRVAFKEGEFDQ